MIDPLVYKTDKFESAIGGSIGFILDKYYFMSTNFEATQRYYLNGEAQSLLDISQNFRLSQNTQLKFKYNSIDKIVKNLQESEKTYKIMFNYYF